MTAAPPKGPEARPTQPEGRPAPAEARPTQPEGRPAPAEEPRETPPPSSFDMSTLDAREEALARAKVQRQALGWAAAGAVATIVWIALPVGTGILLGTLLAFALQPWFERLQVRVRARAAAAIVTGGTAAAMLGVAAALAWLFGARGSVLARRVIDLFGPGGFARQALTAISTYTTRVGLDENDLLDKARALAEKAASSSASIAQLLLESTATGLLGAFFTLITMHYVLRNWDAIVLRAQEMLPLRPMYTADLIAGFRRVGRTTLLGTILTGVAQGVFAGLGYWVCGVPEPVFFGAATAIASLVPAVGTMLVWVPGGIALVLLGHPVSGTLLLIWGTVVVVGISDYVVRPKLVGGEEELPSVVTFAALFGGVEVFGLKGLIVGPVLMSLALAVLRLHAHEARRRRVSLSQG